MATVINKRNNTPGAVPDPADLELGEFAMNTYDGDTWFKKNDGSLLRMMTNENTVDSISNLITANSRLVTAYVKDYHSGIDGGGGVFIWDETRVKSEHNGGTIIDPLITFPTDWANQVSLQAWFNGSDSVGLGCWVRSDSNAVNVKWFGIKGDGTDDSIPVNNAITYASLSGNKTVVNDSYNLNITNSIIGKSNVTFKNNGKIIILSDMTLDGAIIADGLTKFNFVGGEIQVVSASFSKNIILSQNNNKCNFQGINIIDGGFGRYPKGCVNSNNNTRTKYIDIDVENILAMGVSSYDDTYCRFQDMNLEGNSVGTLLETAGGANNIYNNNILINLSNVLYSVLSMNTDASTASGNITVGGGMGVTIGHVGGNSADNSIALGNIITDAKLNGILLQESKGSIIIGNAIKNSYSGVTAQSVSEGCAVIGNTIDNVTGNGIALGNNYAIAGNIVTGGQNSYLANVDYCASVLTGNISRNSKNYGFQYSSWSSMKGGVIVGNLAVDNQVTKTLQVAFNASQQTNVFGNAVDGNAVSDFIGQMSDISRKDLSKTTREMAVWFDGTASGGSGSAGAGNQYIVLAFGGAKYKFLHDGTV